MSANRVCILQNVRVHVAVCRVAGTRLEWAWVGGDRIAWQGKVKVGKGGRRRGEEDEGMRGA